MLTLATQVPRILDQINAGQEWANVKADNSHRTDVKKIRDAVYIIRWEMTTHSKNKVKEQT